MKLIQSALALFAISFTALGAAPVRTLLQDAKAPEAAKEEERKSEPYTLTTCPVSGEKLGSMGDPIVMTVADREVRLCCKGCVGRIEKDPQKYLESVDSALAKQQKPYYPLATCLVTGDPLVEDGKDIAVDVIVKNRLFRVCCKGCVKDLAEKENEYFTKLDAAVVKVQRENYPLTNCVVREKSELGSMGDPIEIVVGNRLVRFCCKGCLPKFDAEPAKFLATIDAAWAPIHARKAGADEKKEEESPSGKQGQ